MPVEDVEGSKDSVDPSVLESNPDEPANIICLPYNIKPVDRYASSCWTVNGAHHEHQSALARSVRPEEAENLLLLDFQGELFDRVSLTEPLADSVENDHCSSTFLGKGLQFAAEHSHPNSSQQNASRSSLNKNPPSTPLFFNQH